MLTSFSEYTRCPASVLEPFAEGRYAPSDKQGRDSGTAIAGKLPFRDPARLPESVQRFIHGEGSAYPSFDIDEVIECLRHERYLDNAAQRGGASGAKSLVRQVYYMMRPLFPVGFRKYLQRTALRGWDSIAFPVWPVDFSTENIMENTWKHLLLSGGLREIPFIWFWPEGHAGCCIMTHDVETKKGRDFCQTMMGMEERYGITSSFELVPEERYEIPKEFLGQIRENGCEVCIHGLNHDGNLFSSKTVFFERAEKINRYAEQWDAAGFRSPVLYRNLDWFHALKFSYDMSVPNVGHLDPQRGGCCTVMPYFIGDILELPVTTVQDYSLYNILQQRSLDLWQQQVAMILERHGLVSFIIHPDYTTAQWSKKLYQGLLEYLARLREERGLWIALPRDVNGWWRARHRMELVNHEGRWQIRGPQSERARIAYASLEKDRVVYKVETM
jgi:hypothetical protein